MTASARQLTASGQYAAVLVSMEVGATYPNDPGAAERAILDAWRGAASAYLPADLGLPPGRRHHQGDRSARRSRRAGQPPIGERTTTEEATSPGGRAVIAIRT